jgi:hypothetical protein
MSAHTIAVLIDLARDIKAAGLKPDKIIRVNVNFMVPPPQLVTQHPEQPTEAPNVPPPPPPPGGPTKRRK